MILDTSAILAVMFQEEDAQRFADAIEAAESPRLSAANLLETSIVLRARKISEAEKLLDRFIEEAGIDIVPVTGEQTRIARQAHYQYGKGSGHPAKLNFGDCFAYALANATGEPLLFKGEDFSETDLRSAT